MYEIIMYDAVLDIEYTILVNNKEELDWFTDLTGDLVVKGAECFS